METLIYVNILHIPDLCTNIVFYASVFLCKYIDTVPNKQIMTEHIQWSDRTVPVFF